LLIQRLDLAVAEGIPVLLAGGSFAFVNICDDLQSRGRSWQLPPGSQTVDGGGFKGRSRVVTVDALRQSVAEVFGIALDRCTNLFGMSELASQLYDSADVCAGPLGERPKSGAEFIRAIVRDPADLTPMPCGTGLLEIVDLCVLDRPHRILTGDSAIARDDGVVITGRIKGGQSRGCSLTLDEMTGGSDVRR
jgi:hypothetical protein